MSFNAQEMLPLPVHAVYLLVCSQVYYLSLPAASSKNF